MDEMTHGGAVKQQPMIFRAEARRRGEGPKEMGQNDQGQFVVRRVRNGLAFCCARGLINPGKMFFRHGFSRIATDQE